jgi:capsular polysaccharide biosynthesis protein
MALICSNWSGTRIVSSNGEADKELSTGSLIAGRRGSNAHHADRHHSRKANRLMLAARNLSNIKQNPFRGISNASVFLQRNGNNYYHFLVEVLPAVMVWLDEVNATPDPHIVLPRSSFAGPLVRLLGFRGAVSLVPFPSVILARHVRGYRQLPAGYINPDLLGELSQRIAGTIDDVSCSGNEVVLLLRGPADTRRLANEHDVIREVRNRFPRCDVIYPGQLSIEEQVCRMRGARIVITPHGAQAANMIWARNLEYFVEIGFSTNPMQTLEGPATALGASYIGIPSRPLVSGDHFSDHECDIDLLGSALAQI